MDISTLIALFVTAFIPMIIGMIWYAKPVFGTRWMRYEGITPEMQEQMKKEPMFKKMLLAYFGHVLLAYLLYTLVNYMVVASIVPALQLGFLLWIGAMLPVGITNFLWTGHKKPFGWLVLNTSYLLVSVLLMSVVLALWI